MRILILGGTVFLGRALVEAALARGHDLTLFNRGQSNPDLFPHVEQLHGDRATDLHALQGRHWDAVIDTCGYVPRIVRLSAEALARAAGPLHLHLVALGLCRHEPAGVDESAPVGTLARRNGRASDRRNVRAAQGAVRASRGASHAGPDAHHPARPHRRPIRSDRPLYVLASSRGARRRGAGAGPSRAPRSIH